jgi:23S rRNA pseudouridine1911/1915/1917 synthase
MQPLIFRVSSSDEGKTLEDFLLHSIELTPRSALKRAFSDGSVRLNDRATTRSTLLHEKDVVEIRSSDLFRKNELKVLADPKAPLSVILETPNLIVANKLAGQNVHPLKPDEDNTTLGALASRYPECTNFTLWTEKPLEGGLVHRIDRGTSGILVCARTIEAHWILKNLWSGREVEKVYLAWVQGKLETSGRYELSAIHAPHARSRMLMFAQPPRHEKSWPAITSVQPIKQIGLNTLVLVRIHTGVMHQIRATFSFLGHPVLGDTVYAEKVRGTDVTPALLDPETQTIFSELKETLSLETACIQPLVPRLPKEAFFLHALWLRARLHSDLASGVVAPIPPHFLRIG